ncbi:MAG: type II toxin-antitoxin system RelE/ParE family toxin [Candidatus Delongbacteria bacterium]
MILTFHDQGTEDVFYGRDSVLARRACPRQLVAAARRRLEQIDSVRFIEELRIPPGNRLEPLAGNRSGQHSIRINRRFRICFTWGSSGPLDVEIVDYHR